eukprot:XP_017454086.1 PREDICTED: uncharacterized protein LOC108352488 [Rattus norvegicus]
MTFPIIAITSIPIATMILTNMTIVPHRSGGCGNCINIEAGELSSVVLKKPVSPLSEGHLVMSLTREWSLFSFFTKSSGKGHRRHVWKTQQIHTKETRVLCYVSNYLCPYLPYLTDLKYWISQGTALVNVEDGEDEFDYDSSGRSDFPDCLQIDDMKVKVEVRSTTTKMATEKRNLVRLWQLYVKCSDVCPIELTIKIHHLSHNDTLTLNC